MKLIIQHEPRRNLHAETIAAVVLVSQGVRCGALDTSTMYYLSQSKATFGAVNHENLPCRRQDRSVRQE